MTPIQKVYIELVRETAHLDGCLQAIGITIAAGDMDELEEQIVRLMNHHPEAAKRLEEALIIEASNEGLHKATSSQAVNTGRNEEPPRGSGPGRLPGAGMA